MKIENIYVNLFSKILCITELFSARGTLKMRETVWKNSIMCISDMFSAKGTLKVWEVWGEIQNSNFLCISKLFSDKGTWKVWGETL